LAKKETFCFKFEFKPHVDKVFHNLWIKYITKLSTIHINYKNIVIHNLIITMQSGVDNLTYNEFKFKTSSLTQKYKILFIKLWIFLVFK